MAHGHKRACAPKEECGADLGRGPPFAASRSPGGRLGILGRASDRTVCRNRCGPRPRSDRSTTWRTPPWWILGTIVAHLPYVTCSPERAGRECIMPATPRGAHALRRPSTPEPNDCNTSDEAAAAPRARRVTTHWSQTTSVPQDALVLVGESNLGRPSDSGPSLAPSRSRRPSRLEGRRWQRATFSGSLPLWRC
jgi:hypothetical protein